MRALFIVHRTNFYKIYGPVIDAALSRGWEVECWLIQDDDISKQYLKPTETNLPKFAGKVGIRPFENIVELQNRLETHPPSVVFSLKPKAAYVKYDISPHLFVTLQSGIDTFVNSDLDQLLSSDILCLYSEFWLEWTANYYKLKFGIDLGRTKNKLEQKATFPGAPQLDPVAFVDPDEIRRRYGIPASKSVVLLLPMTLSNKKGSWPRFFEQQNRVAQMKKLFKGARTQGLEFLVRHWNWPLNGWNDRALTGAIQEFAQGNNAVLIIKGREKDVIRESAANIADIAIYDESHYPATVYELLSVADICFHFYSTAVLESAFANSFGVTIDRPSPGVEFNEAPPPHHLLWRRAEKGSAFNYPGVNRWMTIPEAMRDLPRMKLSNLRVRPTERNAFIQKYLGFADGASSNRLLDTVAEKVALKTNRVQAGI